ncbi:MAG TPA: hypothetical protein VE914_20935 [Candidatus Angelobacter sp.]|nr:hypothetical protein [Candidatus Angelobacter sp.]
MKQTELAAAAALVETLPAPAGAREPKPLKIKERFDPLALSGTANAWLAERLADQVVNCQALPPDTGEEAQAALANSAIAALKELAPAGAAEGLLATQMVASHNASLHLLRRALAESQPERLVEESTRQYARLSEVFLKQLDRYARHRGRQRQTIRIEHVRVVEDGKVTVRQEEERVR